MLILWTSADARTIRQVFGPVLGRNPTEHTVVSDMTQLPEVQPGDVVLACGSKALELMIEKALFPKKRTITSCRETPVAYREATWFATFDPTITLRDIAREPEVKWDLALAVRYVKTGSTAPPRGNYEWVDSLHEVIEFVDHEYERNGGKRVDIACDTETLGLDEYWQGGEKDKEYCPPARIISISFTFKAGQAHMLYFGPDEKPQQPDPWKDIDDCDYWEALWVQINWLLTSEKVSLRGANWKYDSRWIVHHWKITCTNQFFDTLLAGTLLNENISNSLKMHAKMHTDMGGYEEALENRDMGRLDKVPKEELGPYMGGDTDVTYRVANVFKRDLLKDRGLANFFTNLLMPSAKVFEKVERNGILVDKPYMEKLGADIAAEQARLQAAMVSAVPKKLYYKYQEVFENQEVNPFAKPTLMRELFFSGAGFGLKPQQFTDKEKKASTAMDHLLVFADHPDAGYFISLLSELNSANKTQSTYVKGFLKHLRADGRWHPHYMLFRGAYGESDDDSGTDTGRTSAKDPAVQTIPKHTKWAKALRRGIIAPPGYTILQLDYSQGELKITACLADEPVMIDAYRNGKDLHAVTGAKLGGYDFDTFMALDDDIRDPLRSSAKPANFGLIYGMQAESYMEYAFTSYGKKLTIGQAANDREAFFELYSRLPAWHEKYKNIAHTHGFVRSPLGRVRHLPLIASRDRGLASKAERNSINSPVQSTLSDMMQLAMVFIDKEYGDQIQMFLMCHDAVAVYVPTEDAEVWAKRLKSILDNLPLKKMFGWDHQLPFTSDAEIARPDDEGVLHFAGLKKYKVPA